MPRPRLAESAELLSFVRGFSCPTAVPFYGAQLHVDAVLLYEDGLTLEWRISGELDLSSLDIPVDQRFVGKDDKFPPEFDEEQRETLREARAWGGRIQGLWAAASIRMGSSATSSLFVQRWTHHDKTSTGVAHGTYARAPAADDRFELRIGDMEIPLAQSSDSHVEETSLRFGVPGPKRPIPFHGGAVRIIAVLIYPSVVKLEWMVQPYPDADWLAEWSAAEDRFKGLAGPEADPPDISPVARPFFSMTRLWHRATLTDDLRTVYLPQPGSGSHSVRGGVRGMQQFGPAVPRAARELHLTLADLSVFLPLGTR